MKERPVLLGEQKSLLGIVTEPPRDVGSETAPGVVLINAGLVHRIGPNRLYVKLARQLAALGLPVLRFDLSGLGDSRARTDGVPIDERAVVETRTAMSYLAATRHLERFVLVGLCSGADDAFRTACADPRVVGLLLIDPCLYPSTSHTVSGYLRRLVRPRAWVSLLTGQSDLWKRVGRRGRPAAPGAGTEAAWDWKQIPGDELRGGLETLARRGVRIQLVYSPDGSAYHYYRTHVERRADYAPGSPPQVACVAGTDHTFTRRRHQQALLELTRAWGAQLRETDAEPPAPDDASATPPAR